MSILVQCNDRVAAADRAAFDHHSSEVAWPTLQQRGLQMVASGVWTFGEPLDLVTSHYLLPDITQVGELADSDGSDRVGGGLGRSTQLRLIEVDGGMTLEGGAAGEAPPTFGRGSVISERTYVVPTVGQADFASMSADLIWPWLESAGGRLIAYGHDPFGHSEELVTLFAFRSLDEWHRLSRPSAELSPPEEVVAAWVNRSSLIVRHWGRLLTITTDYGRKV